MQQLEIAETLMRTSALGEAAKIAVQETKSVIQIYVERSETERLTGLTTTTSDSLVAISVRQFFRGSSPLAS